MALTGCLLWLFYPGLSDSQVPAFRDAYHFYYPQAVWLQHCADQGSYFPRWNSMEGLGVSVAGQPSAALYYPLRWLWWLPSLSVAQKFSWVLVVHLLIAAGGIKLAARKLGCSDSAAWLAAISFSLSCPVLFQHTNLIYLCSAAWVGFALAAVFDVLQATSLRQYAWSCAVFGCATSLMLLAGDPQSVANTFIVASVVFAAEFIQRLNSVSKVSVVAGVANLWQSLGLPKVRRFPRPIAAATTSATVPSETRPGERSSWPGGKYMPLGSQLLWLLGTLGLVALLGCVQWLPAWHWASHSGRMPAIVKNDVDSSHASADLPPGSVSGAAESDLRSRFSSTPAVDAVLRASSPVLPNRYDFSLSPWHALTCLWPTLGGHYLPSNSRLFALLPAEGRMWIPALYFGCWPSLLALLALFKNGNHLARTLKIVALVAVLAALGNYSVVWLLRELLSGAGLTTLAAHLPKDHVGSLTWLLNSFVPGYSMFRYPAKWTVWIVAATSLLAAWQLSDQSTQKVILPRRLGGAVLALSLIGLALSGCLAIANGLGYSLDAWLDANATDPWLGPPSTSAIANSLAIAFGVPSMVLGLSMFGCPWMLNGGRGVRWKRAKSGSQARSLGHWGSSLTLITLVEMTLCASCWVQFLPAPTLDRARLFADPSGEVTGEPDTPFVWSNRSRANLQRDHFVRSPQSYAEDQASYQQVWLLGKLGLLAEVRCLHAAVSVDPRELIQLRAWLSRRDRQLSQQPDVDRVLRELGVTHRLVRRQPAGERSDIGQPATQPATRPTQFTWQAIAEPLPLCQVLVGRSSPLSTGSEANWRWTSPDRLVIQTTIRRAEAAGVDDDRVLVVRQMNDGGWRAHDASGRALEISREPLFVEVNLSDAVGEIALSRKWFR